MSLTVEAADFHPARRHPAREPADAAGWVGLDRGLSAFVVGATADGAEVARVLSPKPLERGLRHLRRLSRAVARKQPRSANRTKATRRLSCHHARTANARRSFLHETSTRLVKTHDRLALEDLAVANLARNHRLARAVADAAWANFARMVAYKAMWYGAEVATAPAFSPARRRAQAAGSYAT